MKQYKNCLSDCNGTRTHSHLFRLRLETNTQPFDQTVPQWPIRAHSQIKTVVEEYLSSENAAIATYILLVNDHGMIDIANKQTILNKPTSKLKLFKN